MIYFGINFNLFYHTIFINLKYENIITIYFAAIVVG